MVQIRPVKPVKLFCGMIAWNEDVLKTAQGTLTSLFGDIDQQSDIFPFPSTDYYDKEMGNNLLRKFVSFVELIDPARLADIKVKTNSIEKEFAVEQDGGKRRTVNLDPGYVTPAKVILATAKNFSHRIYLRDGIYAETTMNFDKNGCIHHDWTYPDFKLGRYNKFFLELRKLIMAVDPADYCLLHSNS
ncbi:DUF4416 family protein [Verrucomicrobiota bacterium]